MSSLAEIVSRKYRDDYWDDFEGWRLYLRSIGIKIESMDYPSSYGAEGHVVVECPSGLVVFLKHGRQHSRCRLCLPEDLAKKILVLDEMPP